MLALCEEMHRLTFVKGLEEPFPGAKNVSPLLDEQATIRKEKNFFETRVIEYQVGTQLEW